VKEYLNPALVTKMLIKTEEPAHVAKKVKDLEKDKRFEKLQQELFEQKMISGSLRRQLVEMKETQEKRSKELKTMMSDMMATRKPLSDENRFLIRVYEERGMVGQSDKREMVGGIRWIESERIREIGGIGDGIAIERERGGGVVVVREGDNWFLFNQTYSL